MHKKRLFRTPLVALAALLVVLIVPAAAQANHVTGVDVTCAAGNGPATLVVKFEEFRDREKAVTGTISVDGTVVRTYTGPNDLAPVQWGANTPLPDGTLGADGTLTFVTGNLAPGTHTVSVSFSWPYQFGTGSASKEFSCPPVQPPTTTTPPPTTTTPPPGGGTLPETVVSGIARLNGPSGCVKQAFRASVSGRSIAAVAFFLDGKLVKRIARERARYTVKVKPGKLGFGRHRVIARVTFSAESGTSARALPLTFRRCAQGAVQPRFTG